MMIYYRALRQNAFMCDKEDKYAFSINFYIIIIIIIIILY